MDDKVKRGSHEAKPARGSGSRRMYRFVALCIGVFLVLVTWSCAMSKMSSKPSDLDYSTTRMSENGLWKGSYQPLTEPIPLNKIHSWRLRVENAAGRPVVDARISVDGGMPQHGHGLPTKPQATQNFGNGDYLIEGMKFQMHGWWVVHFTVSSGGGTDKVTFNLQL